MVILLEQINQAQERLLKDVELAAVLEDVILHVQVNVTDVLGVVLHVAVYV